MALIEIKAEPGLLKDLLAVLRRIADGIDRAYPPRPPTEVVKAMKPFGPETLIEFDPEAEWQREAEAEARQS